MFCHQKKHNRIAQILESYIGVGDPGESPGAVTKNSISHVSETNAGRTPGTLHQHMVAVELTIDS